MSIVTLVIVNKLKRMLIVLGVICALFVGVFVFFFAKPKVAGVFIETEPQSLVFINGREVGETPYKALRSPGDIVLKLFPNGSASKLDAYETKLALVSGVETVVRYSFGENTDRSSAEIISFEKIANDETSLAIVSIPNSVNISIDGSIQAVTPHKTSGLLEGEHSLVLSADGYQTKTIKVKTHLGYKLTAIVTLAKNMGTTKGASTAQVKTSSTGEKGTVLILDTAGGILHVRAAPTLTSEVVGEVPNGEEFPFIDFDDKTAWYKITFEEGKAGWVSGEYVRRKGANGAFETPTPTKSPTLTPVPSPTLAG